MSGLIWSALGQSVANASNTIGGMMLRDIDDQRKREDEERREARAREAEDRREAAAIKRMEEADRIKSERDAKREEELQQRVIKDTAAARARGQEIGRAREAAAYDKLAESSALAGEQGDVPLTKEQLAAFSSKNPSIARQYRGMGLIDQNLPLSAQERRLRSAEDELAGAMETGAHSSVIKGFQEIRKGVLDEIREENRGRAEAARQEATDRRLDQIDRRIESQNRTDQQRADAATKRANQPPAGRGSDGEKPITGVDLERTAKAAEKELALALGVPVQQVAEEVARRSRKGALEPKVQSALDNYNMSLQRWREFRQKPGEAPSPASAASMPAPQSRAEFDKLPKGTRYKAPDGSIRIK